VTWPFWLSYVALWIIVGVFGVAMLMMLREHAELLLNVGEGRSRMHGPADGTVAPSLYGRRLQTDCDGTQRPRIVVFMGVTCEPCWGRREVVSYFASDHVDSLETVVCCSGSEEAVREFATELGPNVSVLVDRQGVSAAKWRVFMTPFAVGLDADGVVRGKISNPGYDTLLLLARTLVAEQTSLKVG